MSNTPITEITNRAEFDKVTSAATTPTFEHENGLPTVILITHAPGPMTKAFLPDFMELTKDEKWSHVRFCTMEESPETSPMIKFGPQARPIAMLVCACLYYRRIEIMPCLLGDRSYSAHEMISRLRH